MKLPGILEQRRRGGDVAVFAPGRINLLGDHIDYVGGCVLPMGLQFGTYVLIQPNARSGMVTATSNNQVDPVRLSSDGQGDASGWGVFVSGALQLLADDGAKVPAADIWIHGDIPASSLSSSASFTCALLFGLLRYVGQTRPPIQIARMARRVETDFVGVSCGLMDQAAACLAPADGLLYFDCASEVGMQLSIAPEVSVLVLGTGQTRELVGSPYNERQQSARAAIDAGLNADNLEARPDLDSLLLRRGRHVITEMRRTRDAPELVRQGNWRALGDLMNVSHRSLRDDFQVSSVALNAMVECAQQAPGVMGARMSGGGFGGAAVALVDSANATQALAFINREYRRRSSLEPTIFHARSVGALRTF